MGDAELAKRVRSGVPLISSGDKEAELTVSWKAAEAQCTKELCGAFSGMLGAYPTTLEDDEWIQAESEMSGARQMALSLIIAEKKILHGALAAARALPALGSTSSSSSGGY